MVSVFTLFFLTACTSLSLNSVRPRVHHVADPTQIYSIQGAGNLINQMRLANNQPLIASNTTLTRAASVQAGYMAQKGKMDHKTGFKRGFKQRMKEAGVEGISGENIASGYKTIEETVQGWMISPPHRKIMLDPRYTKFGIAVRADPRTNRPYWALVMGV